MGWIKYVVKHLMAVIYYNKYLNKCLDIHKKLFVTIMSFNVSIWIQNIQSH